MEATIFGTITKPAVIIVGTWDPFVFEYFKLVDHLNDYCSRKDYEPLLVVLDPPPVHLIHNQVLPIFDSCAARIKFLSSRCQGAVSRFSMKEYELGNGVEDFLQVFFDQQIQVAELWLYEGQTMGRGGKSNIRTLTEACHQLGIQVQTIPGHLNFKEQGVNAKGLLHNGALGQVIQLIGHIPMWERPEGLAGIPIGWKPGCYGYKPVAASSNQFYRLSSERGAIEVYKNDAGHSVFDWPDGNNRLIAITG